MLLTATPTPDIKDLSNKPVIPPGIITPLNQLLGMATFGVLILAILAFIVTAGLLILSALGRGGDGLENLIRRVLKVFIGCFLATSALAIMTAITGGF
ncbi:Uncharacterised protein [Actinomyces bovis]|uniref:Uncharacterized protein n=1 Tax=Actinomyces bovis TaxID=1658 RepID=A0ABY1VP71_9ACTO|nr:hypothetical protein [Actinomyces bovis]SPT53466.1 Uncharacterised protein [Actinomyces bovis]VEG55332.1 Uncharacterised protein [Actinomyces israelii]